MNRKLLAVIFIIAVLVGAFFYNKYRIPPKINFGYIQLTDLAGMPVKLEDYKNKTRFVNFFATWCGPCMGEMPSLDRAAASLKKDNFVFICISDEPVARIKFLQEQTPNLIILHSTQKLSAMDVATVPTSYVLNPEARVVFKKIGVMDWESTEVVEELKKATNN